jgi:hypothetical protein
MIKNNKMPCSNVSTETYTGKEQSPKRYGLSAEGFDINHDLEGFDGKIWTVQYKNNRKVWIRKNIMTIVTHEQPIITDNTIENTVDTNQITENNEEKEVVVAPSSNNHEEQKQEETVDTASDKKKTDYNIFVKYYLDKLKKEDTNKTANKVLFQQTTQEWARLKKNPDELKVIMAQLKKINLI